MVSQPEQPELFVLLLGGLWSFEGLVVSSKSVRDFDVHEPPGAFRPGSDQYGVESTVRFLDGLTD